MRKLVLPGEMLLSIQQPTRYIDGEVSTVNKDFSQVEIRFVMCFPDVYEIGMSHLGIRILYDMFSRREDIWCKRVYPPWTDLDRIMRKGKIPLFTLESQNPVKDFDFLGITLQYEVSCTDILQTLDLSQIPLHAPRHSGSNPIVIGGGPCAYNPGPLAEFLNIFHIGEGETSYYELMDQYKENKKQSGSRLSFLEMAAGIPDIYVPAFYDVTYKGDGIIESFLPDSPHTRPVIEKVVIKEMGMVYYIEKPIVPFIKVTQDRVVLETQRGYIRSCRFCQAGNIYRPLREHGLDYLKDYAYKTLKSTGHEEIPLSSLSSSDYTQLGGLVNFLINEFREKGVNISLPSLRVGAFSLDVISRAQDVKKSSFTFAPEVGSQRLRDVINKGLTEEVILQGAAEMFKGGWNRVKLYFMLGPPTETVENTEGIALLSEKVAGEHYEIPKDQRNGRVQVVASPSFFIPKPFIPFQWARMCIKEEFLERAYIVKDKFRGMKNFKSLKHNYHEADLTALEGVLTRSDRWTGTLIEGTYRQGALLESWSEDFNNQLRMDAFETRGIGLDSYAIRERSLDGIFPWNFIDAGTTKELLKRGWLQAIDERVTPNCRQRCSARGARKYEGSIYYEGKN